MTEIELPVPALASWQTLSQIVEQCCAAEGLIVTLRGTLATYRGSIHWHLKRPGCRGVLEATLWPEGRCVWFSIHDNRRGDWMDEAVERLGRAIQGEAGLE